MVVFGGGICRDFWMIITEVIAVDQHRYFIARVMFLGASLVCFGCGGEPAPADNDDATSPPVILYGEDMQPEDMGAEVEPVEDMSQASDLSLEVDMPLDMPADGVDMSATADMADMPPLPGEDEVEVRVIAQGSEVFDDRTHPYTLLAITNARTRQVTYAQWVEPDGGHVQGGPVMVLTQPYAGIDWTGEEVDQRWAALGDGAHPDVDSPGEVPANPEHIVYNRLSVRAGVDGAMVYLLNGISALHVFGRFYAGGDVEDDVEDMANGMRYLATREDIDKDNIGVFGGSWGGFEAFYAAMRAPEEVTPEVGVAFFPVTDFEQEVRYLDAFSQVQSATQRDAYQTFFAPYVRRIFATTGGAPDAPGASYEGWNHAAVQQQLRTPFFIFHDDQDTLVPFTMSEDLIGNALVSHTWFLHPDPVSLESAGPSHGLTIANHDLSVNTLATVLLMSRLKDDGGTLLTLADSVAFEAMLSTLHAQNGRGQTLGNFPAMLADLASARVQIYDLQTNAFVAGPVFVSAAVNAVWGTSYTPEEIEGVLRAF